MKTDVNKIKTLVVIGLGCLSKNLIEDICIRKGNSLKVYVITRNELAIEWCRIQSIISGISINVILGNALNESFLTEAITLSKPDVVIQSASLLSPFCFTDHPLSDVSKAAGFGLQLCAQLPIAFMVMKVVTKVIPSSIVINCSFPDVVNPILKCHGYSPFSGIGNAGIIHYLIDKNINISTLNKKRSIQVFSHHTHAITLLKNYELPGLPDPLIYIDGEPVEWSKVRPSFNRALNGDEINILTAASASALLHSIIYSDYIRTSVAGPLGTEGGRPVTFTGKDLLLDEVAGLSETEIESFFNACRIFDGIDTISSEGVVTFSDKYKEVVKKYSKILCEPLSADTSLEAVRILSGIIKSGRKSTSNCYQA